MNLIQKLTWIFTFIPQDANISNYIQGDVVLSTSSPT